MIGIECAAFLDALRFVLAAGAVAHREARPAMTGSKSSMGEESGVGSRRVGISLQHRSLHHEALAIPSIVIGRDSVSRRAFVGILSGPQLNRYRTAALR